MCLNIKNLDASIKFMKYSNNAYTNHTSDIYVVRFGVYFMDGNLERIFTIIFSKFANSISMEVLMKENSRTIFLRTVNFP